MALNKEALKNKLLKLQEQTNKNTNIWKPKPGKNTIRIVPYKWRPDDPFLELLVHFNVAKSPIVSPMTHGNPDPIYDFSQVLQAEANEKKDKEEWKAAKKLEPTLRYYVPIVVREEEDKGVKFWGLGAKVFKQLSDVALDPDYGDITDLVRGRDITVTYTKSNNNPYGDTTIVIKPKETPLASSKEEISNIINTQVKIEDVFPTKTFEEMEAILEAYVSGKSEKTLSDKSDDLSDNDDVPHTTKKTALETASKHSSSKISSDVTSDDDFDELFNGNN